MHNFLKYILASYLMFSHKISGMDMPIIVSLSIRSHPALVQESRDSIERLSHLPKVMPLVDAGFKFTL